MATTTGKTTPATRRRSKKSTGSASSKEVVVKSTVLTINPGDQVFNTSVDDVLANRIVKTAQENISTPLLENPMSHHHGENEEHDHHHDHTMHEHVAHDEEHSGVCNCSNFPWKKVLILGAIALAIVSIFALVSRRNRD